MCDSRTILEFKSVTQGEIVHTITFCDDCGFTARTDRIDSEFEEYIAPEIEPYLSDNRTEWCIFHLLIRDPKGLSGVPLPPWIDRLRADFGEE